MFTNKALQRFAKVKLIPIIDNLIDQIWVTRPDKPASKVYIYHEEFAGQSYIDKLNICYEVLNQFSASNLIITSIDSICWLLNLRANDVEFSPVILGSLLITIDKIYFFTDITRISQNIKKDRQNIIFLPEEQFPEILSSAKGKVLIDANYASSFIMNLISKHDVQKIDDPCQLPKACKNNVELQHAIESHIKDAIAVCEFLSEISTLRLDEITEYDLGLILMNFRSGQPGYVMDSFPTICGFKENSSIIHYRATQENAKTILGEGVLLIDSGAQYMGATTDITRTINIGPSTELQKRRYTQVLKGHIALASIKFPANTNGSNLDILARQFLWSEYNDYNHGTGHGVGSFLSVHEGPQSINQRNNIPLKPGMILSNEPGFYISGEFGIRIENLMYVKEVNRGSDWMEFEQLTLVPYAKDLINRSMLVDSEIEFIRNYYQKIQNLVYPLLSQKAQKWFVYNFLP